MTYIIDRIDCHTRLVRVRWNVTGAELHGRTLCSKPGYELRSGEFFTKSTTRKRLFMGFQWLSMALSIGLKAFHSAAQDIRHAGSGGLLRTLIGLRSKEVRHQSWLKGTSQGA